MRGNNYRYGNLDLPERLQGVAVDLVSEKGNEAFVRRLFSANEAEWQEVRSLCEGIKRITERELLEVERLVEDELHVTWLRCPWWGNDDFALVIFYMDELGGTFAAFNMAALGK